MDTRKTGSPISNHTRARINYAFDVLVKGGASVTTLTYVEVKAIVLRALAGEFDQEIELASGACVKVSVAIRAAREAVLEARRGSRWLQYDAADIEADMRRALGDDANIGNKEYPRTR
jgi:hypothetical protein